MDCFAEYCDDRVCLSVICLSESITPELYSDFHNVMHVTYVSGSILPWRRFKHGKKKINAIGSSSFSDQDLCVLFTDF